MQNGADEKLINAISFQVTMFFLIIILYALSASSFTIAKAILAYAAPIFFVGFRMTAAGLLLGSYAYYKNQFKHLFIKKNFLRIGCIILFHIYLSFIFDLVALQYMSSFKGAFLYNTSPFISALFAYFVFSERMTGIKWLGLFIGLAGFLPELIRQAPSEAHWFSIFFLSKAELLMLASVFSSVIGWTVMRSLALEGNSVIAINATGMIAGGLLALLTSAMFESWHPVPVFAWPTFIKLTGLIIIVANILFYNLYGYLLKQYTSTFLSFCGFLSPLFAALFGWLFLGETVSWHFFFSVFVVIIGLLLFYKQELKQGYIRQR